jgi:hypothetical protein
VAARKPLIQLSRNCSGAGLRVRLRRRRSYAKSRTGGIRATRLSREFRCRLRRGVVYEFDWSHDIRDSKIFFGYGRADMRTFKAIITPSRLTAGGSGEESEARSRTSAFFRGASRRVSLPLSWSSIVKAMVNVPCAPNVNLKAALKGARVF